MSTTTVRTRTRTSSTEAVAGSQTGGNGRGGRGRGRGRGGDRGRGRGRGRGEEPRFPGPAHHLTPNPEVQPPSHTGTATTRQPKPRLTHFLALPIGHHAGLRRRISAFTDALLRTDPAIPGLDETIVINPRRLHLTLGVMSLDLDGTTSHGTRPKTLDTAAQLLNELKPQVMKMLAGEKLRIGLKRIDIMKPERGDLEKAHILWTGPAQEGEDAKRLRDVSSKFTCPYNNFPGNVLIAAEHRFCSQGVSESGTGGG
ncbi:hypothetical protein QCA50_014507 [Cerrena zonata]|uniref:A-kinase anchor protein 7-like phosphoesterase domain-containing protein n=1 Tax=Cerrena zonata TaxID=2478898 RepID=A0AAW0FRW7_9APHY